MNDDERGTVASSSNTLAVEVQPGAPAIVVATGEIDVANVALLRRAMQKVASESDIVIVDLTDAAYIDSSTLELFVVTTRELVLKRGELRIVAPPNSRARRVLAISGVEADLSLYDAKEDATKIE